MDWIQSLLFNDASVAHTVILYAFVIAVGVALGKLKFFGVSLGVTFVLFVGLIAGHFGFSAEKNILHFVQEFGLILFIYSIGLQVGPSFFSSFKRGGLTLNMLAVGIVVLNIAVALGIYFLNEDQVSMPMMVGILSGAVTNTPGLGAAQQTLSQLRFDGSITEVPEIALGYAAAYPLGVIGIIASMLVIRAIFKVKLDKENKQIEEENQSSQLVPHVVTYQVENKLIVGKTLDDLAKLIDRNFVVSRIKHNDEVMIPNSDTLLQEGDLLLVVLSLQDESALEAFIGRPVEMNWEAIQAPVVSRRILVTRPEINGRKIGSLRLRMGYRLNATRVNRAGLDLLANPNLELQIGDRLTVIGEKAAIKRVESILGNSVNSLREPNLAAIFIGIVLGLVLGSIPLSIPGISSPVKMGLAGGPIIVGILVGCFGPRLHMRIYTTRSANLMLRGIGLSLYLAGIGIDAGAHFFETVVRPEGLVWVASGFLITVVPLLLLAPVAMRWCKMNFGTTCGMLCGSMANPMALNYVNDSLPGNDASVSYATVYPLGMFLRVVISQVVLMLFL